MLNDLHSIAETPETPQMFVACREYGSRQKHRNGFSFGLGMNKPKEMQKQRKKGKYLW